MEYKIFIAGSKSLDVERDACRSECSKLQNSWGTILTRTFEDFSETISENGHQNDYNNFIKNEADLVIFVFSGSVGSITRTEYDQAYKSFKKYKHPKIIVYFDKRNSDNDDIVNLKKELSESNQYYQEYEDINELKSKVHDHINKILIEKNRQENKKQHTEQSSQPSALRVPAMFVVIWLALAFVGGLIMYIIDSNMSDAACKTMAVKYMENYDDNKLIYVFPEQTFVYDMETQSLSMHTMNNPLPGSDVSISGIEHVTFGATASVLLARALKFKVKGNAKTVAAYVAAVACAAIGCGVGCVVEQMLFPPRYSNRMLEYLSSEENWAHIATQRKPSRLF